METGTMIMIMDDAGIFLEERVARQGVMTNDDGEPAIATEERYYYLYYFVHSFRLTDICCLTVMSL